MNNTTYYKKPTASLVSPYQIMKKQMSDVQNTEHPAQKEIKKVVGIYQMTAEVQEDKLDIASLRSIPGLIAFICSIKNASGEIIGIGRGSVALGRNQKFVEKAVRSAFNFSILSAIAQSSRALDAIANPHGDISLESVEAIPESITDKQKSYLTELVQKKIKDVDAHVFWMNQINGGMSKNDASSAIQELAGK